MNATQFIQKWRKVQLTESAASQEHFLDLCALLGHPTPAAADPEGASFTFERGAAKRGGGDGWADVWKKGFFGWEYKGKHKDLDAAYKQLLQYHEALDNPPLLVACDMDRLVVHTKFTGYPTTSHEIALDDFASSKGLNVLRALFFDPEKLRPESPDTGVTEVAARHIAEIAQSLRDRGLEPHAVARFLDRIVFCLFAEDVGLLPDGLFARIVGKTRHDAARFTRMLAQLFDAMAHGGDFGMESIPHFNGDLFVAQPPSAVPVGGASLPREEAVFVGGVSLPREEAPRGPGTARLQEEDTLRGPETARLQPSSAGGLVLELTPDEIESVHAAAKLDWSAIQPSIFGTLFERGLDPSKRSQLGAHYTSREDIVTLVEPVVMQPLRREWDELRATLDSLLTTGTKTSHAEAAEGAEHAEKRSSEAGHSEIGNRQSAIGNTRRLRGPALAKARDEAAVLVNRFRIRLSQVKVLDPACGSGNFLYVTLQLLKDLEKAVITYAADRDLGSFFPYVLPTQLYGIEINPYAYELAQMTVWIGHLQWNRNNGFDTRETPILRPMHNFECKDAILERRQTPFGVPPLGGSLLGVPPLGGSSLGVPPLGGSSSPAPTQPPRPPEGGTPNQERPPEGGTPNQERPPEGGTTSSEPEWPRVDFIVGNPPFLGDKKMRGELGDEYVEALRRLYQGRLPGAADLCCYWFEKARAHLAAGMCGRAGLLATQNIRGGASREVLRRIKQSGGIFFAVSDREWILDGALVHISIVGFDNGSERQCFLDAQPVGCINANLSSSVDVTVANRLLESTSIGYIGSCKGGAFDITETDAIGLLHAGGNPHGRPNSDVLRPLLNSKELLGREAGRWIIDNANLSLDEACLYERPHSIVQLRVKPDRDSNRDKWLRENWWRPQRMRLEMREAIAPLSRFLVTPTTSKHRIFTWLGHPELPDHKLVVLARADDCFFGVVHSRLHETWSRAQGTQLRERESGLNYNVQSSLETFPFPHPTPEQEAAIGEAARELNELRERWLNPPEWTRTEFLEFPGTVGGPWDRYIAGDSVGGASLPREEIPRGPGTARLQEQEIPRGPGTARLQEEEIPRGPGTARLQEETPRGAETPRPPTKIGTVRYPRLVAKDAECAKKLKARTLTNLYNQRPTWLDLAHQKLDAAVFAAYGWDPAMSDEEILEELLALNLERARDGNWPPGAGAQKPEGLHP